MTVGTGQMVCTENSIALFCFEIQDALGGQMCRVNPTPSVVLRSSTVNNRLRICKDAVKKQQVSVWNIYLLVVTWRWVEFEEREKKKGPSNTRWTTYGVHPSQPLMNDCTYWTVEHSELNTSSSSCTVTVAHMLVTETANRFTCAYSSTRLFIWGSRYIFQVWLNYGGCVRGLRAAYFSVWQLNWRVAVLEKEQLHTKRHTCSYRRL